ncbi:MAG: hypothetical protein SGILL_002081 [Bacillariaceae sp.]
MYPTKRSPQQYPSKAVAFNAQNSGQAKGFQKRYAGSPFVQGYKATGGDLPQENADFLQSETMWKYLSNKCLKDENETIPEWQKRAPAVILLGAMKCGTHALTESLWEHPLVARNGHWELHFFDNDKPIRTDQGIYASQTRHAYANAFRKASPEFFENMVQRNNDDTSMIAMESSPRYVLSSDRLPHLILCVVPWIKFLVMVRDPVGRAESQYRYLDEARRAIDKPMVDWEAWIDDDLRLLREAGVFSAQNRDEERLAWKKYQRRPNSNMIVGRGLYVLQLLDYFEAMDEYGKARSDMLVIQSERFRHNRQEEYNGVLQFLGLPPHTLQNAREEIHVTLHKDEAPMPVSTKRELRKIYHPYNQRLYELLGWSESFQWR